MTYLKRFPSGQSVSYQHFAGLVDDLWLQDPSTVPRPCADGSKGRNWVVGGNAVAELRKSTRLKFAAETNVRT